MPFSRRSRKVARSLVALPARTPLRATLSKYGLTVDDWLAEFEAQGSVCKICQKPAWSGRYVVDHEHVKGFKLLTFQYRRWFVRGIICTTCNSHVMSRYMTLEKARNVVEYLQRYELRKAMK